MAARRHEPKSEAQPALSLGPPAPIAVAAILAWLAWLARAYWGKLALSPAVLGELGSTLPAVLLRAGPFLAARLAWLCALWLVAVALGSLWARVLRLKGSRLEGLLLAAGLGFGSLSLLLLGLGAAGLYSPPILKGLFLAGAAAALATSRWWRGWLPGEAAARRERLGPWESAALLVMAATVLLEACASLAPEIFYDALIYHLALPKLYLLKGRLASIPYNVYSGLPLLMQMLYGLTLSLSDDRLASLLHSSLGWAAAAAAYAAGRRFFSRPAGIFAAFAFLTSPVAIYAAWACGVDLGASFLCAAGLLALTRDLLPEEAPDGAATPLWPACAGLLLGFACGTKYNVLPFAAILVPIHAWQSRGQGRSWRGTMILSAALGAAFLPWLLKNAALFSNPLYPFLRNVFGDPGWLCDWQAFLTAAGSRQPGLTLAAWKDLLLRPWAASVGTWPKGDWPGPVFLILLPWLFLMRARRPSATAVLAAAAGSYVAWALASNLVRYLLPAFPFLALAAALAVENDALPRWLRRLGWLAALYAAVFNMQVCFQLGQFIGQWDCLLGRVSRADYLKTPRHTYGLPYYSAAEFINQKLPPEARVLLLGESRTYYIERDCIAATVYDRNPFWLAAAEARDGEDLLARVRGLGVTHVFLSVPQLLFRQDSPGILPRPAARRGAFADFWGRHLKTLYEDREDGGSNPRWLLVYEVSDLPNPPDKPTPNPVSAALHYLDGLDRP